MASSSETSFPDDRLPDQFDAAGQSLGVAFGQLQIIIGETQRAIAEGDEQNHPDKLVPQVGPKDRGNAEREKDQATKEN